MRVLERVGLAVQAEASRLRQLGLADRRDPGAQTAARFVEIEDEARWAAIAQTEVCQRWWKHMGDVMPSNADHSPVASGLKEVFYLE